VCGAIFYRRLLTRPIQFLYVVLLAFSLPAQDTRNVTEPVIPAPCAALTARLSTAGIDETALDTNRIQQAIDSCPAGHAVKLVAHGNFNAFLSGPLQLRSGVTLQVDKGAILFGSRNPRDYEGFQGDGFTVWGVAIFSPKTARNTDGIDPANSKNVTIAHCYIHTGDDQVAIKAGGTGGPSMNMTVAHNHFYTGHGISIRSETDAGANHIYVSDLTIDGADNGIRIKSNSSRGGLVENVLYEGVCIRDTKNPILIDSNYSFYGKERNKPPTFRNITLRNVHIYGSGKITLDGYDTSHSLKMEFDNVTISGAMKISGVHADLALGPGPVNFRPAG
jgi:polygalacturonase